jgi:hypothetical protein
MCHLQGASYVLMSYLKAEMVILFVMYCECWWLMRSAGQHNTRNYKCTQQLTLPRRYSQLVAVASLRVRNPRHRSSSNTFLFGKICSWTEFFVDRGVREPRFHCTVILFSLYLIIFFVCIEFDLLKINCAALQQITTICVVF